MNNKNHKQLVGWGLMLILSVGMLVGFSVCVAAEEKQPKAVTDAQEDSQHPVEKPGKGPFAPIGAGLALGLCALGTGLAQARIGAAGVAAVTESPKNLGLVIMLMAIPETMAVLGFVVAYLLIS